MHLITHTYDKMYWHLASIGYVIYFNRVANRCHQSEI